MKRNWAAGLFCLAILTSAGCSTSDRERAEQKAAEARQKTKEEAERMRREAQKLGHEAAQQARDLNRNLGKALNGNEEVQDRTSQAEEKLKRGGAELRAAGDKAAVKLSHVATVAKVKARLARDLGLSTVAGIDVDASGQTVTLRGSVPSEEQKQQAEQAAREVDGVTKVVNDLTVKP